MTDDTMNQTLQTLDTADWGVTGKYSSSDGRYTLIIRQGELPNGGGQSFVYYIQPAGEAKDDFIKTYQEKIGPTVPWQPDGSCYFTHHAAAREGLASSLAFAIGPMKFKMGINFLGQSGAILKALQNDRPRVEPQRSRIILPSSYRG